MPHEPTIPVFSTYRQRENQLTHGLAATLVQCPEFRRVFIRAITAKLPRNHHLRQFSINKLVKHATLSTQSYFGNPGTAIEEDEPDKTIPDMVIEWDGAALGDEGYSPCIVIEAKVEAAWRRTQAVNHYRFAVRLGLKPVGLAITAVNLDPDDLPNNWMAVSWSDIYQLAKTARINNRFWVHQLALLMETTEAKLMNSTNYSGALTQFAGIPFVNDDVHYTPAAARRIMRLLVKDLIAQQKELKKADISVSEPKSISSQPDGSIWYEADTLPFYRRKLRSEQKAPHLNITIGEDLFACGLTFPNASFNKFYRKGIQSLVEQEQLEKELLQLLKRLMATTPNRIDAAPYAYLLQQHFINQRSPASHDAQLRFDLRTLTGYRNRRQKLNIKKNTQWVDMLAEMVLEKEPTCHYQAGYGMKVMYSPNNTSFLNSPSDVTSFIIDTWKALYPLAGKMADFS